MSILYTNKTYLFMSDRLNNAHLHSSIFCFKQRSVTSHFSEMPSSGDLRSGDLFLDQNPPPPSTKFASTKQFCGKNMDLSVRDFNWLNTHPIRLSII